MSRLARERGALDAEEGRWLLRALRSAAHAHLGYASFTQYIERLFGYRPRTTLEKLRVAEALEALPRLTHALEAGALSWCAARELTRVVLPETEQAWLEAARGKTLRELESLVTSKAPGDAPDARGSELPRQRVLRFEVAPETFATFREAMQQVRRLAGSSLDDDAVLLALARQVLGGPRDAGRSSYQVSISVCGVCGSGAQRAGGELVPVDAAVVAMAACDGQQHGGFVAAAVEHRAANENASLQADRTADVDIPSRRAGEANADETSARPQSSDHAHVGVPSGPRSGRQSGEHSGQLSGRDSGQQNGRHSGQQNGRHSGQQSEAASVPAAIAAGSTPTRPAEPSPPRRAKQSIPPALRRNVLTRDRHRCTVPGCTHATFVDVHHIQPRSEGGRHEASNLLTLCSAHHRAVHRGELLIQRDGEKTTCFRHADGAGYGSPMMPRRIDAHAKVFAALRHLGFRESEVNAVLAELRGDVVLANVSVEQLLREALCRIKPMAR